MVAGWAARLFLLGVAGITGAMAPALPARGTSSRGAAVSTSITQHGVTLTLTVPGRAYPAHALVPTTLRLTNISAHPIRTDDCLRSSLFTAVGPRKPSGIQQLYPPLLPGPFAPWSDCPGDEYQPRFVPRVTTLGPGETLTVRRDVVLRSFQVRGIADLQTAQLTRAAIVQTPPIVLRRVSGVSGPRISPRSRPVVEAVIVPVSGAGPLLYSEWAWCGYRIRAAHRDRTTAPFSQWRRATGSILRPFAVPCTQLAEWTLFVAQAGRPVAQVEYCPRHDRCNYAPPSRQEHGIAAYKQSVAAAARASNGASGHQPGSGARAT